MSDTLTKSKGAGAASVVAPELRDAAIKPEATRVAAVNALEPTSAATKSESAGAPADLRVVAPEATDSATKSERASPPPDLRVITPEPKVHTMHTARVRIGPLLITLATGAVAAAFGWAMWNAYMGAPWTRDGTVRVYVVTIAPEVSGRIVELPVADNQFVHRGDSLMTIDPINYKIALRQAEAAEKQAEVNAQNSQKAAERRRKLVSTLAVSVEQEENYVTNAIMAEAQHQQAAANLEQSKVNLERTQIRSPVNGWVTNLLVQLGDYGSVGHNVISIVNADSFWIDAYFEETKLDSIHDGDPATVKLMGYSQNIRGHVDGVARGIDVSNMQPDSQGLATVNPIFTWVRLAQRVPVRIRIDQIPDGVRLAAGMTATVQINPLLARPAN
jgi:multidrug resistance efflux pump